MRYLMVTLCRAEDRSEVSAVSQKSGVFRGGRSLSAVMVAALSGVLVLGLALPVTATTTPASASLVVGPAGSPAAAASVVNGKGKPRFAGHRPGRVYLGMSCGEFCPQKEAQLGAHFGMKRWFKKWGNWGGVAEAIQEDRSKHRLPWISVEGPGDTPSGWRAVGQGKYDADIRQLGKVLKAHNGKPIFLSFGHEVSNNAPDSLGRWWASGFKRFHDVLQRAHALKRVSLAPIMAGWLFGQSNPQNPGAWLPPGVLRRSDFLGVDVYQNISGQTYNQRIPPIDRWLGRHGHRHMMIGLGETGATSKFGNVSAASWLNKSLRWVARHRNKVVAVSYFNSTHDSDPNVYWPLDESANKLSVYRKWLRKPAFINHVR